MDHFHKAISGWCDFEDLYADAVRRAPADQPSTFVEVGVWMGRSLAFLAVEALNSGKPIKVVGVDDWSGSPGEQAEYGAPSAMLVWMRENGITSDGAYEQCVRNIAPVKDHVSIMRMKSVEAASQFADKSLDFVFIDGDHSYAPVKADLAAWIPKVRAGGTIAGHDWGLPSVSRAVREALPRGGPASAGSWSCRIS